MTHQPNGQLKYCYLIYFELLRPEFDQIFHVCSYVKCFNTWEYVKDLNYQSEYYNYIQYIKIYVWYYYIQSILDIILLATNFKFGLAKFKWHHTLYWWYSRTLPRLRNGNRKTTNTLDFVAVMLGIDINKYWVYAFLQRWLMIFAEPCRLCSLTHGIYGWCCTRITHLYRYSVSLALSWYSSIQPIYNA